MKMRLNRRGFVVAVGCLVSSGCIGGKGANENNEDGSTNGGRVTNEKDGMSLQADKTPKGLPAEITPSLERGMTDEEPPRLRITFASVASEQKEFHFGHFAPFSNYFGESEEGSKLVLLPDERDHLNPEPRKYYENKSRLVPDEPIDGCWEIPTTYLAPDEIQAGQTLQPEEEISEGYTVLNHPENDGCFPPGEYHFSQSYQFEDSGYLWEFYISVPYKGER
jgi:hypothetical protein